MRYGVDLERPQSHHGGVHMRGDARPGPDSGFDAKLSLGDFVVGASDNLLQPPEGFTEWRQAGAWEAELYEPNMLGSADVRTSIEYDGKAQPVINLCSYNYLGLANHPEVVEAATEALRKYGVGACGSPTLSGMTDMHRRLEQAMATFLGRDDVDSFQ